ncbi:MAG: FKBP-type peptidyl-prolyl cis-trans isomerase [Terracidiphilus sp.]|jgi:peptidylprolyl isomerase
MKKTALLLLMAASAAAVSAQTPANPATAPQKPATTSKSSTAAKPATTSAKTAAPADKLPAGLTALKIPKTTLYSMALRYQDEKVGDGAPAEPGKLLKFHYTLWTTGENGAKFDSSHDHPGQPVKDKDGKPVMGDDGKPKLGDPQPVPAIMGQGRPLPGWDMGVEGMKVGGKRRIFIPWQLGFGAREIPAHDATHPAVPPKTDLIVDLELVDVADAPQQQRPAMGGMHPQMGAPMGAHPMPGAPGAPPAPGATSAPHPAAPAPAAVPAPAATPAPAPAAPAQPQSK